MKLLERAWEMLKRDELKGLQSEIQWAYRLRADKDLSATEDKALIDGCRSGALSLERIEGHIAKLNEFDAMVERAARLTRKHDLVKAEAEAARKRLAEFERMQKEVAGLRSAVNRAGWTWSTVSASLLELEQFKNSNALLFQEVDVAKKVQEAVGALDA